MDITKQPATGAAETVLLFHQWIHPLHVNNCLLQLSYQIWPQKTTEGSPDCWANWYSPPHSPRTVLIQSEQKGWQNPSDPSHPAHSLFELLQSSEHQNDQTQEQFSSLRQSISWTLDIKRGTHIKHYYTLLIHHTFLFFISNFHMSDLTHDLRSDLYYLLFLLFCTLPFCILFFNLLCSVLLLSFCCTVELLSL